MLITHSHLSIFQVAADLLFTGRLVDSAEAVKLGLVAKSSDNAVETSLEIARFSFFILYFVYSS